MRQKCFLFQSKHILLYFWLFSIQTLKITRISNRQWDTGISSISAVKWNRERFKKSMFSVALDSLRAKQIARSVGLGCERTAYQVSQVIVLNLRPISEMWIGRSLKKILNIFIKSIIFQIYNVICHFLYLKYTQIFPNHVNSHYKIHVLTKNI